MNKSEIDTAVQAIDRQIDDTRADFAAKRETHRQAGITVAAAGGDQAKFDEALHALRAAERATIGEAEALADLHHERTELMAQRAHAPDAPPVSEEGENANDVAVIPGLSEAVETAAE